MENVIDAQIKDAANDLIEDFLQYRTGAEN